MQQNRVETADWYGEQGGVMPEICKHCDCPSTGCILVMLSPMVMRRYYGRISRYSNIERKENSSR